MWVMKSMTDAVFPQPESALDSPLLKAEVARDMEALLEAIHTKDSALLEKENALLEKDDIIQKKSQIIEEQKKRITLLEEYLRLERARLYGRSSEKSDNQVELFNEVELASCETPPDEPAQPEPDSNARPSRKGRQPFSPSLPRVQERAELSEEEKAVYPATDEHGQEKRVIKAAALPKHPLPKSSMSVSTLAWIIVSKYCDALPLYRQENMLNRYGGSVTHTTMANSLIRLSMSLQPLINLMRDHQKEGAVINADEIRTRVIKESNKSINSDKYMWVSLGGTPGQPSVLFEYYPSRSKEIHLRLFEGFSGYLQTDGYASYNVVCKHEGIIRAGCFDHVRRKFTDAKKGEAKLGKKAQNAKVSKADVALGKTYKLYAIEAEIEKLSSAEKLAIRQQKSKPLLNDLHEWLEKNVTHLVPGSLIHSGPWSSQGHTIAKTNLRRTPHPRSPTTNRSRRSLRNPAIRKCDEKVRLSSAATVYYSGIG